RDYLQDRGMGHTRGAPYHPMTQGKIERFHRSMKNEIRLQHYYLPEELEQEINRFIEYYNNERYHESLNNVTPADVYFGRYQEVITRREQLKRETMKHRRLHNLKPQDHKHQLHNLTISRSIS
ncbi:MAG: integrase core domain-containing protein, partial [Bacteroidota bacterium]